MPAIDRFLTVSASTLRSPTVVSGKRGAPETFYASIKCTPLDPVDAEVRERLGLGSGPARLLQAFVDGDKDIQSGDVLVVSGEKYPVRVAEDWAWRKSKFLRLIIEDIREPI